MGIGIEEFVAGESISDSLRCPICRDVFNEPVFCGGRPCQCVFCRSCLAEHLRRGDARCPIDRLPMQENHISRHLFVKGVIDELLVFCRHRDSGCCWTGKLESRNHHEATCPARKVQVLTDEVVQLQTEAHALETRVECLSSQLLEKSTQIHVLSSSAKEHQNVIYTLESKLSQQYRQVWEELWLSGEMKNGELARVGPHAGYDYCLLNLDWYARWHRWINGFVACLGTLVDRSSHERVWPGSIDNSVLLEPDDVAVLRQGICEGQDFVVVSVKAWKLLQTWYGGGPTLRRRAVCFLSGCVEIELYGIRLQIFTSASLHVPFTMVESSTATVGAFKMRVCDELELDPSKVRVWDYFNRRKYEEITAFESKTLEACHLFDGNPVLIEHQCEDGSWPSIPEQQLLRHYFSQPPQPYANVRPEFPTGHRDRSLPQRLTLAAASAGVA